ncbi:MAG: HAMP domain-containing protein, partial [Bdellovibrio sp.]
MNWSFRKWITIILTVLVIVPTVVLGTIGYWTSNKVIRNETIRVVGLVANTKKEILVFRLNAQLERAKGFLASVQFTCLHSGRKDSLCAQRLLSAYMETESIIAADITIPGILSIHQGPGSEIIKKHSPFLPKQLAQFSSRSDETPSYIIEAQGQIPGSSITLRYGTKIIENIFLAPPELGSSGETFLVDPKGFFLTKPRYPGHSGESHPIDALPMVTCLAHHDTEMLAGDYRPVPVIHGFRYIPEIGGGCIMAHIQQSEAFAPLKKLSSMILFLAFIFVVVAVSISFWLAGRFSRRITTPLAKLGERMKAAQNGDLESPVYKGGPKEIAVLEQYFEDLTNQLKQSFEIRDDFVAIVSHDLKSPLTSLNLIASRLE